MATQESKPQIHPANAVFALMEDRAFRFSVIRPAMENDKAGLCRLTTGKYQLKGFRNIAKAPSIMLLPVLSDEANVSADLARTVLQSWYDEEIDLRSRVGEKLTSRGYTPRPTPFDEEGQVTWNVMKPDDANAQFDGHFLPDDDKNAVMLMSLLLGWFGTNDEEQPTEE